MNDLAEKEMAAEVARQLHRILAALHPLISPPDQWDRSDLEIGMSGELWDDLRRHCGDVYYRPADPQRVTSELDPVVDPFRMTLFGVAVRTHFDGWQRSRIELRLTLPDTPLG